MCSHSSTSPMPKHLRDLMKKDLMHKQIWVKTESFKNEVSKEVSSQKFKVLPDDSFDPAVLRKILTNWITSSDQAFIELENPWLQRAFEYCNSSSLQALVTGYFSF